MTSLWSFLLQTLTASGAAVLLLTVKAIFRDKLSPRWQFAMWGILGLVLLLPAGFRGRYLLVNWPRLVETAKSALTGDYGTLTRVIAPIPLPAPGVPHSATGWLYALYLAGAALLLGRYLLHYLRLRLALRRGRPTVYSLSSAFLCGVCRPVLALPAGVETDEKIILHELLHLKYYDTLWGVVICFFKCIHWCNPLLWMCANWAANDLETLCDQRVLERLEGEARRDYGRILLSMADERYAQAPGTSSMANGGKNIRRRIEAIARFRLYPADMTLVSVCMTLVLAAPLLAGTRAQALEMPSTLGDLSVMASARTVYCTTYAGALDTYAKAILTQSLPYRAMCTPLSKQNTLAAAYLGEQSWPESIPPQPVIPGSGYQIYNLEPVDGGYEGLLAVELAASTEKNLTLGVQRVRAERQGDRWVVLPLEDFWTVPSDSAALTTFPCVELPAWSYEGQTEDFTLQMRRQSVSYVNSTVSSGNVPFLHTTGLDLTPKPDGTFTVRHGEALFAHYTGDPADKANYTHIGSESAALWPDQARPVLSQQAWMGVGNWVSSSSDGTSASGQSLEGDWKDTLFLTGGGGSGQDAFARPEGYLVQLYLNKKLAAELTLLPVEGGIS